MDKEYICLSCLNTIWTPLECPDCGRKSCPVCHGEVSTIQEYDEAMKANKEQK